MIRDSFVFAVGRCQAFTCAVLAVAASGLVAANATADVLVPADSSWKWHHATDDVDPAKTDEDFYSTFYQSDFDDSEWKTGKDSKGPHGGFGYGDEGFEGIDLGVPSYTVDRKPAYFRLQFTTDKDYEGLVFRCQRDDGIIVYLDGKEVLRDNVAKDAEQGHAVYAATTISGASETELNTLPLEAELAAGDHVLAISLHNRPGTSSDLRIAEISLVTADEVKSDEAKDSE